MCEANDFKSEGISCTCNVFWGCLDEEGQFKGMIDAWRIFWPFSHQSFARALVVNPKWIMQELVIWIQSLQFLLLLPLHSEITDNKYAMLWLTQNMSFLEYFQFESNQRQERKVASQGWNKATLVRQKMMEWRVEAGSSGQLQTSTCESVTPGSLYSLWRSRQYSQEHISCPKTNI